jgi:hypothetical protein
MRIAIPGDNIYIALAMMKTHQSQAQITLHKPNFLSKMPKSKAKKQNKPTSGVTSLKAGFRRITSGDYHNIVISTRQALISRPLQVKLRALLLPHPPIPLPPTRVKSPSLSSTASSLPSWKKRKKPLPSPTRTTTVMSFVTLTGRHGTATSRTFR